MEELGALLQKRRLDKQLSLEELEERTKIQTRFLIAIEAGKIEHLPAEVYLRGFLRTYAKAIGMNPDDVIKQYEYVTSSDTIQEKRSDLRKRKALARRRQRIIAVTILCLVLIAYFIYFVSTLG